MFNNILEKILKIFYLKIKNLKNNYKTSYQHRLVDEFNYYKIYHKEKISKFYEIHKTDFDKAIHFGDYRDTRKFSLKKALENFKDEWIIKNKYEFIKFNIISIKTILASKIIH